MNKEVTISFKNQNRFRIVPDSNITTGKVIVNGIEITSVEDWEKVTKSLIKLQQENEKLNHYKLLYQKVKDRNDKAIEFVEELYDNTDDITCYDIDRNTRDDLLVILKGNNGELEK